MITITGLIIVNNVEPKIRNDQQVYFGVHCFLIKGKHSQLSQWSCMNMKGYLIVCIRKIPYVQCLKHQFADKMLNERKVWSRQQSVVLEFQKSCL